MLRISLTLLLCLAALNFRLFVNCDNANADICSLNNECRNVTDCPFVIEHFNDTKDKPYCDLDKPGTFVCCPVMPEKYIQAKDEEKRVVKECASYKSIRPKCEVTLRVGNKVEPKELPFMALLSYFDGIKHKWLCEGTLISSKFVLTAASCFLSSDTANNVRLGELDYNKTDDDAEPIDFAIKGNATIHPEFDIFKKINDIALVELDGEVKFNDYIMPACLPLVDGRQFDEYLLAGWYLLKPGKSSHLSQAKLHNFDDKTCLEIIEPTTVINTTIQMCASSFSPAQDTCTGGSGAPLFVYYPDFDFCMYLILGVLSHGEGDCGIVGYPDFYTRVSAYVDWIEGIVWP